MKLHLGVVDMPYAGPGKGQTTGAVAEIIEARYHVMETFYTLHEDDVARAFENTMQGALDNLMMGAPVRSNSLAAAEADIESAFRKFLDAGEIEGLGIPGVPTGAAKRGVNHRLKSKRGAPRPSFIDTGLYEASFKAWVE